MIVVRNTDTFPEAGNTIVTTGTFDGVHRGHRKIFHAMKHLSSKTGMKTVVVTFHPHPRQVLQKEPEKLHLLTTLDEKIELVKSTGIDYLVIIEFTRDFAKLNPAEFISDILVKNLHAQLVFTGYDHAFGKGQSGSKNTLKEISAQHGLNVHEVEALQENGHIISSSIIREHLEKGEVEAAAKKLGYPYRIQGIVVKGNRLGRKIGYPTANIAVRDKLKLIPEPGVYAVHVYTPEGRHNGMLNIGKRPTLNTSKATVEVHIFNLNADLYEQEITVSFVKFIRKENKFNNMNELRKQLDRDKDVAGKILE
ncbi:MAG: bifunctional riboflavin kinase/FAD synthetase [Bacteroidales bacterium]